MNQYLQPVDYILLAMQALLALAMLRMLAYTPLRGLRLWAGFNLALGPVWLILAFTVTTEHFGDWCIRLNLVDSLLLAFSVVEISAALFPYARNKVWQRGAGCIAAALVVMGIAGPHTALQLMCADTLVVLSVSFGVLGCCLVLSTNAEACRPLARAVCLFILGQAVASQAPLMLGCITPACLIQHTWQAAIARRSMPVLWAVGAAYITTQINKRSN